MTVWIGLNWLKTVSLAGFYEDFNESSNSELVLNLLRGSSIRIIFELVCLNFSNLLFGSSGHYQLCDSFVVGWPRKLKTSRNFYSACHGLRFLTRKGTDPSGDFFLAFLHKTGWNPTPFFYCTLLFNNIWSEFPVHINTHTVSCVWVY